MGLKRPANINMKSKIWQQSISGFCFHCQAAGPSDVIVGGMSWYILVLHPLCSQWTTFCSLQISFSEHLQLQKAHPMGILWPSWQISLSQILHLAFSASDFTKCSHAFEHFLWSIGSVITWLGLVRKEADRQIGSS